MVLGFETTLSSAIPPRLFTFRDTSSTPAKVAVSRLLSA